MLNRTNTASLVVTTALGGLLLVSPALAQTINTPTTSAVNLGSGGTLTVTSTGSITTGGPSVIVDSVIANSITNDGVLDSSSSTSAIVVFGIGMAGDVAGGITNNGTIMNMGFSGAGIFTDFGGLTDISGGITNNAGASITNNSFTNAALNFNSVLTGSIVNNGTIENTTTGPAIHFAAGSTSFLQFNSGSITRATDTPISVGSGGITGGGIIVNDGALIEATLGATAFNLNGVTGTTLITINGGTINGGVSGVSAAASGLLPLIVGGDFSTNGDFFLSSLTINSGANLTISGGDTFVFNSGTSTINGTLTFGIDAAGNAGRLLAGGGSVIDLTGAIVEVNTDASAPFMVGQEIDIGFGSGAVIGVDGNPGQALTTVADNSALFNFEIADGSQTEITTSSANNELFLLVSQAAIASQLAQNPNTQSAGTVVDSLIGSSNAEIMQLNTNLGNAATGGNVDEILESILPGTVDSGAFQASQSTSNTTFSLAGNRLGGIRTGGALGAGSGIASGDITQGLQMWGQVFGQTLDQGRRQGIDGFEADTYGIAAGIDTEQLYDNAVIGVAFAYANTDVDSDNANRTDTDIDSFQIALYGDYDLNDRTFISGAFGYTFGNNESTRFDVGGVSGLNANADFNSNQFSAQIRAGRDYTFVNKLPGAIFTPNVSAQYLYYKADDYTESGAGGASLSVDNESVEAFEFGVGVDARKDYELQNGGRLTPEVSLGYRYDFINDSVQATSTFTGGGAAFAVEGFDPSRSTFNLGLAASYETPTNWDVTASYDYETKSDFNSHAGFVRASYKF